MKRRMKPQRRVRLDIVVLAVVVIAALLSASQAAEADEFPIETPENEGDGLRVRATDVWGNPVFPATFAIVDETGEVLTSCTQASADAAACVFDTTPDSDADRYLAEVGFPAGQRPGMFRGRSANCDLASPDDGYVGAFPAVLITPGMKACDFVHFFDELGPCGDLWRPTCPQPSQTPTPPDNVGTPRPTPTPVPEPIQSISERDDEVDEFGDTGIEQPDPTPPRPSRGESECGAGTTTFCLTMMIDEIATAPPGGLAWYFYDQRSAEFAHFILTDERWTTVEEWGGQDFIIVPPPGYRINVTCEGDSAAAWTPEVRWTNGENQAIRLVADANGSTYANCHVRHDPAAIDLGISICGLPVNSDETAVTSRICTPHLAATGGVTAVVPIAPQPLEFTVTNVGGRDLDGVLVEKQDAAEDDGWTQICDLGTLAAGDGVSCINDNAPNLTGDLYRASAFPEGAREVVVSPDLTGKIVDNRTNPDPFNTVCYTEPGSTDLICVPIVRAVPEDERVTDLEEILVHDDQTPILTLQTYEIAKIGNDGTTTVERSMAVKNESPTGTTITEIEIYLGLEPIPADWCEPTTTLNSGEFIKCELGPLPPGPELVAATGIPLSEGRAIRGYPRLWASAWIVPGLVEASMVIEDDTETVLSSLTTQKITGWVEFVGVDVERIAGFSMETTDDLGTRCSLSATAQSVLCSLDLDGVSEYPIPFSLGIEALLVAEDGESLKTWADSIEISPLIPGKGDADCDGDLDFDDVQAILSYRARTISGGNSCEDPSESIFLPAADVNSDGEVNLLDALLVNRCDEGISTPGVCP